MSLFISLLVYHILPPPLARGLIAALIYLGMLSRRWFFVGPRIAQISLPATCDHNCAFCITDIHGTGRLSLKNPLELQALKLRVRELLKKGTLHYNLVSPGEPLLYPRIKELIEFISSTSRGRAQIKIVTNGTSLDRLGVDFVVRHNVHLWISLHAGDFETWTRIHRPFVQAEEKFNSLKRFLTDLHQRAPGRVTLHNVIHKDNFLKLESISEFASRVGAQTLFFGPLYKFPELQLNYDEQLQAVETLKRLQEDLRSSNLKTNISAYLEAFPPKKPSEPKPPPSPLVLTSEYYKKHRCYIPWLLTLIDTEGLSQFCGAGPQVTSKSHFHSLTHEAVGLSVRKVPVTGCDCSNCPHIQMNMIANRFLP